MPKTPTLINGGQNPSASANANAHASATANANANAYSQPNQGGYG